MRKYRPYFTLQELKTLEGFSRLHSQTSSLTRYLSRYISDIESGFRKENMALKTVDIETSLGFKPKIDDRTVYEKEQEYRYLNNLMSPQEESDYEIEQGRTGI